MSVTGLLPHQILRKLHRMTPEERKGLYYRLGKEGISWSEWLNYRLDMYLAAKSPPSAGTKTEEKNV